VIETLTVQTRGQGLYDISREVAEIVSKAGIEEGLCTVFLQHTSASLIIQENADPAVQHDLQHWLSRLVAENDPLYTHTDEGPDDMPAHIKTALTVNSLSIPCLAGRPALGTWQGIYVWEHRRHGGTRRLVVHVGD
jgi:secondary thiamine-phosphate synthase enzyme